MSVCMKFSNSHLEKDDANLTVYKKLGRDPMRSMFELSLIRYFIKP